MQLEEVCLQSALEGGQHLCCSDLTTVEPEQTVVMTGRWKYRAGETSGVLQWLNEEV